MQSLMVRNGQEALETWHPDAHIRYTPMPLMSARHASGPHHRPMASGVLALRLHDMFGELDVSFLRDLESELKLVTLRGGETLYRQGEAGDTLSIVVSVRLRVVVRRESGDEYEAELGRGETVGEMSVVSSEPQTATIVAIRDTNVAVLSRAGYQRLLVEHPLAMTHIVT